MSSNGDVIDSASELGLPSLSPSATVQTMAEAFLEAALAAALQKFFFGQQGLRNEFHGC